MVALEEHVILWASSLICEVAEVCDGAVGVNADLDLLEGLVLGPLSCCFLLLVRICFRLGGGLHASMGLPLRTCKRAGFLSGMALVQY